MQAIILYAGVVAKYDQYGGNRKMVNFVGTIAACLSSGEYDQGDQCLVDFDDLYNLNDKARKLEEANARHTLTAIMRICDVCGSDRCGDDHEICYRCKYEELKAQQKI
jgi:hypothetical protein